MRISRREFVKSFTASGIALSVSRLASAEEPPFAARETLPGTGAATYGEKIREELAANNPALLVLDREFESQSVDPMALEPESGLAWYDAGRKKLEFVVGVASP